MWIKLSTDWIDLNKVILAEDVGDGHIRLWFNQERPFRVYFNADAQLIREYLDHLVEF